MGTCDKNATRCNNTRRAVALQKLPQILSSGMLFLSQILRLLIHKIVSITLRRFL